MITITAICSNIKYGHHIPNKKVKQSLRLCIKLSEKLSGDCYHYFMDLHDEKWGELLMKTEDIYINAKKHGALQFSRKNVVSDTEKEQEILEFRNARKNDELIMERDARLLFSIIAKYYPYWWD